MAKARIKRTIGTRSSANRDVASAKARLKYKNFYYYRTFLRLKAVDSWMKWEDHFGNILNIGGDRVVVKKAELTTTADMLFKTNLERIYKYSTWVCLLDERMYLLGGDGMLRCAVIADGRFSGCIPPIWNGFKETKGIVDKILGESGDNYGVIDKLSETLESKIYQVIG